MDKRFWAIIGAIVVVFLGILAFNGKTKAPGDGGNKPTSHIQGKGSSGVTLVEYGDYECPVCENYYQVVKQVQAKYNDKIFFQFRNLPLSQIHPNAFAGARAAEAADLQGKFWQMHDLLYNSNNWQEWSTSSKPTPFFQSYAQQLGLNMTKFNSDFSSDTVNNRINADIDAFNKTRQQMATPAFFLDSKFVPNKNLVDSSGQPSLDAFSKVIDAELAKKTAK